MQRNVDVIPRRIAYVCNFETESVSIIDIENHTLVQNVQVGKYPVFTLCCPHDQRKFLVTLHNYEQKAEDALLERIDLSTCDIQKIQYARTAVPSGIAYDATRDMLFVADQNTDQGYIHVHKGKTLQKLASIPAGRATAHMDISSDSKYLVATNRLSADLSLYDLEKESVTSLEPVSIPLQYSDVCHPFDVKCAGNPELCYVTDFRTGELLVVDIIRGMVIDRIQVGEYLFGLCLDKIGSTAYVCDLAKTAVHIVDLRRKDVHQIEGLAGKSSHCAFNETARQLVVACQGGEAGGSVDFVDLDTQSILTSITDDKIRGCIGVTIEA